MPLNGDGCRLRGDPSAADLAAGFHYSSDCTNDGTFELSDTTVTTHACTYAPNGTFTAKGRIQDKDDGFADCTVAVTVLTPRHGIDSLIGQVQALVPETSNGGQGNALVAK